MLFCICRGFTLSTMKVYEFLDADINTKAILRKRERRGLHRQVLTKYETWKTKKTGVRFTFKELMNLLIFGLPSSTMC
jgi:hypothetical protein